MQLIPQGDKNIKNQFTADKGHQRSNLEWPYIQKKF